jgi:hypothetical protein
MKNIHTIESVSYGAAGRRWTFTVGDPENPAYTYATNRMPGGRPTADKVARIINGANKRTKGKGMDALGSANMNKVFHDQATAQRMPICHVGFSPESMTA